MADFSAAAPVDLFEASLGTGGALQENPCFCWSPPMDSGDIFEILMFLQEEEEEVYFKPLFPGSSRHMVIQLSMCFRKRLVLP